MKMGVRHGGVNSPQEVHDLVCYKKVPPSLAIAGDPPSAGKAKQMLKDNSAQGHPLTSKQKRYFGALAGGAKSKTY